MRYGEKSEKALQESRNEKVSRRILYETSLILVLTFVAQFLPSYLRTIFTFAPLVYFFIELYFRRRTWKEVGFSLRTIPQDVVANWLPILLVSIVIQFLVVWAAKTWMPAFIDHVMARFPLGVGQTTNYLPMLLIGTLVGALFEEISFRALFQERLSWYIPAPIAIAIVSVVFGIGHWARGDPVIVMIDVLLVIVDSVFYGIIFARSKNVYVSWVAHFLANLFALGFVLVL
jgi:membrane protease YdiL (CAAX protease family)